MSYRIVLGSPAKESLRGFSRPLRVAVGDRLLGLADAPVSQSRPATFPHPPGSQVHEFDVDDPFDPDLWHHFAVFFCYGQDEESIHVIAIGHTEFERGF